ncbi:MAG: DUF4357 domain-containing protein [Succinivibrio sp.]
MKDGIYFLTDGCGNKTHAVMPIAVYEELLSLRELAGSAAARDKSGIYSIRKGGICARGYPEGPRSAPSFVLIRGSQACLEAVSSLPAHARELREKLLGDGTLVLDAANNCFALTRDLKLKSPSLAAAIVTGSVRDGLEAWRSSGGFSLKQSGFGLKPRARGRGAKAAIEPTGKTSKER